MEKQGIEWGWFKVLATLITFIVTIALVFIAMMPAFEGTFQHKDLYSLVLALANALRLFEFLFVQKTLQLAAWILSTLVLNCLSFLVMNYDEFMPLLAAMDQGGASAGSGDS